MSFCGYTAHYDYNEDSWDIGAGSHTYFLKSDEEMIADLGHHDWDFVLCFKDKTQSEIPAADQSGNFDASFFNRELMIPQDTHVSWIDGYWYAPSSLGDQIVRCTFNVDPEGAEYLDLPEPNLMILGCYEIGGCLYVHTREAIFQYDPADGSFAKILVLEGGAGAVFSEMNTASGALNVVEIIPSGDSGAEDITWTTNTITIPAEDLPALAEAVSSEAAAEDSSAAGEDSSAPSESIPNEQISEDTSGPPVICGVAIAGLAIIAAAVYLITRRKRKS